MGKPWENAAAAEATKKPWENAQAAETKIDPAQPSVAAIGNPDGPSAPPQKDLLDKYNDFDKSISRKIEETPYIGPAVTGADKILKAIEHYGGKAIQGPVRALTTLGSGAVGMLPGVKQPTDVGDYINMMIPGTETPGAGDLYARQYPGLNTEHKIPGLENHPITGKGLLNMGGDALASWGLAKGLPKAGNAVYDSAFKKIDERLLEQGKTPLSTIMKENGTPVGTTSQLKDKATQIGNEAKATRDAAYEKVNPGGATTENAPVPPTPKARAVLEEMRQDPTLEAQANELEKHLDTYGEGNTPIGVLSKWKSNLANSLPKSFYTATADGKQVLTPWGQRYKNALASDFRQGVLDAGDAAEPGLGDAIEKANDTMASTLEAQNPMKMQVRRGNTKDLFSSMDGILSTHPKILALKKAADLAKTSVLRTGVGKAMMMTPQGAVLPAADMLNYSPWDLKGDQNGEK